MGARPLAYLAVGVGRVAGIGGRDGQIGPWLDEIVVVGGPLAGHELLDDLEVEQVLLVHPVRAAVPAQGVVGGTDNARKGTIAIGQHQPVLAFRVLKEV
ncbi:hypothetical protein D9M72_247560 [compost metagenome]